MASDRPAHKFGLLPLAADIAAIHRNFGFGKGVFRKAMDSVPSAWLMRNLPAIELIEKKGYNDHSFVRNLRLALRTLNTRIEPED